MASFSCMNVLKQLDNCTEPIEPAQLLHKTNDSKNKNKDDDLEDEISYTMLAPMNCSLDHFEEVNETPACSDVSTMLIPNLEALSYSIPSNTVTNSILDSSEIGSLLLNQVELVDVDQVSEVIQNVSLGHGSNEDVFRNDVMIDEWPEPDLLEMGYRPINTRKRARNPDEWPRHANKKKKDCGQPYQNYRKQWLPEKLPIHKDCSKCPLKSCKQKTPNGFLCARISEGSIKSKRNCQSRRKCTLIYTLNVAGEDHKVCKGFFLKTLNVSEKVTRNALEYKSLARNYAGRDQRGRKGPNKATEASVSFACQHISSYPSVESHYTRKSSLRKYLDSSLNVKLMYEHYNEKCQNSGLRSISLSKFHAVFNNEFNLSFHKPKKDQCATCVKYTNLSGENKQNFHEAYENHRHAKQRAQEEKATDKQKAKDCLNRVKSVTFDLQSVLHTPCSMVSTMFYKRKLSVYNLKIYDQVLPHDAYCYVWPETEGKRGSNEIAICLYRYLYSLPSSVTEISLFSDTCSGQNRNQNVAAAFMFAVQKTPLQRIDQKFLVSGHTYMECDSMHSSIEKAKKRIPIYCIQDWINIITLARKRNPYKVIEFNCKDFFDFKQFSQQLLVNVSKDTAGEKVQWLKIVWLRFEKNDLYVIKFKYNFDGEFKKIEVRNSVSRISRQRSTQFPDIRGIQPKQAYSCRLPISVAKKADLISLCNSGAVREEYHQFYYGLQSDKSVRDCLPEPDNAESSDEECL